MKKKKGLASIKEIIRNKKKVLNKKKLTEVSHDANPSGYFLENEIFKLQDQWNLFVKEIDNYYMDTPIFTNSDNYPFKSTNFSDVCESVNMWLYDVVDNLNTYDEEIAFDESDLADDLEETKNLEDKECKDKECEKQELTEGTSNFKSYTNFPLLVFLTYDEVQSDIDYYIEEAYKEYINNKFPEGNFDELKDYEQEEEYEKFREENAERIEEEFFSELETAWLDDLALEELEERIEKVNTKIKNLYYELDDKEYDTELTEEESDDKDYLYDLKIGVEDGYYAGGQLTISDEYDFNHLSKGLRDKILGWVNDIKKEFHLTQLSVAYRFSNGETGYDIVEKKECCKGKKHSHKKPCKDCKDKKN